MKSRVHLVIGREAQAGVIGGHLDLTTTVESPRAAGQDPVVNAVRAVADLTVNAIKEITR